LRFSKRRQTRDVEGNKEETLRKRRWKRRRRRRRRREKKEEPHTTTMKTSLACYFFRCSWEGGGEADKSKEGVY
jgi:hypothetical protein